jgi:hypothetical protein
VFQFDATGNPIGVFATGLTSPSGLEFNSAGNLYVADTGTNQVLVYNSGGILQFGFGAAFLSSPVGLAIAPSTRVLVASRGTNQLLEFDSLGNLLASFGGTFLNSPQGVAVNAAGTIYVANAGSNQVDVFDSLGNHRASFGSTFLNAPDGVAIGLSNHVYVANTGDNQVDVFDAAGNHISSFGGTFLSSPTGLAIDSSDNAYVASSATNQIVEFDSVGNFRASFGSTVLNSPSGVTLAESGHIFVSTLDVAAQSVTGYIPGVQLSPSQSAQVAVSNISNTATTTTINVLNADGSIFMTRTAQVQANKTFVFPFSNGNAAAVYSAVVTSSAPNSIVCDFQIFSATGAVAAVLQPQPEPTMVLNTPSVRLVPGQSAAATVTNITAVTAQFSVTVLDLNGNIVVSQSAVLNPGQTLSYPFTNTGTRNNGYRAVVSTGTTNTVVSDVLVFNKVTGRVNAILIPQPEPG